jgi:hypothetical protein
MAQTKRQAPIFKYNSDEQGRKERKDITQLREQSRETVHGIRQSREGIMNLSRIFGVDHQAQAFLFNHNKARRPTMIPFES